MAQGCELLCGGTLNSCCACEDEFCSYCDMGSEGTSLRGLRRRYLGLACSGWFVFAAFLHLHVETSVVSPGAAERREC